jgi:uncharacterized protein
MIEGRGLRRLALASCVALLVAGCGGDPENGDGPPDADAPPNDVGIETDAILLFDRGERGGPVELQVAVADTPEERATGLMGVENLGENQGMVFLHDEPTLSGFWMKDTLIPLSLAVWDEDGTILSILDMEPCPEEPCPTYDPGEAWIGAVEVNQGYFDEQGIGVGDVVRLQADA